MSDTLTNRAGFFGRLRGVMNRAAGRMGYKFHVAAANAWRDQYNPLRGLTIQRAVCLLEDGERGAFTDLQWTYRYIEMQDATLGALIERRTSAIQGLDWNIKTRDDVPADKQAIAARQEQALRNAYEGCENLSEALEFLAMASFRGFSHLEKITDGEGNLRCLQPVEQWFWVRKGLYGGWEYNGESVIGKNTGTPVAEGRFVIREVARPINRVALVAFIRKALSQKDWDGFIESYGIPAVFLTMPDNVPPDQEDEYLAMAENTVGDARGVLPHGADVKTVDNGARGVNPFRDHLKYQDEQVILRGTGGKLTMLAESGSGTLAGGAHAETFDEIAKADAAEISEVLRKSIDAAILRKVTPGERAWAYFELAANEETDTSAIVEDAAKLASAGFTIRREWLEEKTGYEFEKPNSEGERPNDPGADDGVLNRGGFRTLDDGRVVYIDELENPTDRDQGGSPRRAKKSSGSSKPKKKKSASEKVHDIRDEAHRATQEREKRAAKFKEQKPLGRRDYVQPGQELQPITESKLKEFVGQTVKLPDGRLGEVAQGNLRGLLWVHSHQDDNAAVPWDQVEIVKNRAEAPDMQGEGNPLAEVMQEARTAHDSDLAGLAERIEAAMGMEEPEQALALGRLLEELPGMTAAPELEETLGELMARAIAGEFLTESEVNES